MEERMQSPRNVISPGKKTVVVGISGATCSGKTTAVERLGQEVQHMVVVHQDTYYLVEEEVPTMEDGTRMWDVPEALDIQKLVEHLEAVVKAPQRFCSACTHSPVVDTCHVVFVEGTMIHSIRGLKSLFDLAFFITLDFEVCKERRSNKVFVSEASPDKKVIPDPPGYLEHHVWPEYCKQLDILKTDSSIRFLQGGENLDDLTHTISTSIQKLII